MFPHFRGLDRGGEFCNFSPFFLDFRPLWLPGPSKEHLQGRNKCKKISFGKLFWPQNELSAGGRCKPHKNQGSHIHHQNLSSVAPLSSPKRFTPQTSIDPVQRVSKYRSSQCRFCAELEKLSSKNWKKYSRWGQRRKN